jgi:hypothetical protein
MNLNAESMEKLAERLVCPISKALPLNPVVALAERLVCPKTQ